MSGSFPILNRVFVSVPLRDQAQRRNGQLFPRCGRPSRRGAAVTTRRVEVGTLKWAQQTVWRGCFRPRGTILEAEGPPTVLTHTGGVGALGVLDTNDGLDRLHSQRRQKVCVERARAQVGEDLASYEAAVTRSSRTSLVS